MASDAELWLTTVTATWPGTLRLKEIQYKVQARRRGIDKVLFECWIAVANQRVNPRVEVHVDFRAPENDWAPFLRPRP